MKLHDIFNSVDDH